MMASVAEEAADAGHAPPGSERPPTTPAAPATPELAPAQRERQQMDAQRTTDVTYADDTVYVLWVRDPLAVPEQLALAVTLAVRAAGARGLTVNDAKGKS